MHRSLALFAPLVLAACASAAEPAAAPTRNALENLRAGGTFAFSLDESAPATMWHARCASEHTTDAAAAAACYDAVKQEGSQEGFRFSVDTAGRLVWTSFGVEDGKPATYIEVPLDASLEKEGVVAARPAERAKGLQVQDNPLREGIVLRFQMVDPDTLVTVDPQKGKLVFHRVPGAGG